MAGLIFKWRYLKAGASGKHSKNLIKYIATRDGVEKLDDSWKLSPATKAQKKLIAEMLDDYPDTADSPEYQEYERTQSKGAASEFISSVIEDKIDLVGKRENYVEYIAKRPHVERIGTHGLFTYCDTPIDLSAVAKEVAEHKGLVFTEVLSLQRDDAVRLGYDNGKAWRDMLRGQTESMATAMQIPLTDLRWYAAFHNESYHPHVHIIAYSVGKEPYMTEQGLHKLKSAFANEIFKQDLLQVYEVQTIHRDALRQKSRDVLSEIISQINATGYENETMELMFLKLADILSRTKGKKVYGYLPQPARNLVNGIVDELEKDSRISTLYDLWYDQRDKILKTYRDDTPERIPLSQNKEFRSIKNAVIQEALNLLHDNVTFEDDEDESNSENNKYETENVRLYRMAKKLLDKESDEFDPEKAIRLLQESAMLGNANAMYMLGKMCLYGQYIKPDYDTAMSWLRAAATHGNVYARHLLSSSAKRRPTVLAAMRLFSHLARIFQNNLHLEEEEEIHQVTDKKLKQKIAEKMELHGQKMG